MLAKGNYFANILVPDTKAHIQGSGGVHALMGKDQRNIR